MSSPLRTVAAGFAIAAASLAGVVSRAQENPDPMALLDASVNAIADAPALSVDIVTTVRLVAGSENSEKANGYRYLRGDKGRFAFTALDDQGAPTEEGIVVRGDRGLVFTHILPLKRYTLEESTKGFAPFVRSNLAEGVAKGLGPLGLSFLDAAAAEELKTEIENPEYVGAEDLDGVATHHCRYFIGGELPVDVWYAAEGAPMVLRVLPDLSETTKNSPLAKQHDNFEYSVGFDYRSWDVQAKLGDEEFRIARPEGSRFVESFYKPSAPKPHPQLGARAAPFELETLDGKAFNLADHLGKDVVLLDFWATWCPPCVAALPKIDRVAASFADRGVVFYAVNQQEDAETVVGFLEEKGLTPPTLLDLEGAAAAAYGVEGLPTSVLIGRDGRVQVVHIGLSGSLEKKLTAELEALVAEKDLAGEAIAKFAAEGKRLEDLADTRWTKLGQ
jgi:thiol-disulfide isomerase/thioredoxin